MGVQITDDWASAEPDRRAVIEYDGAARRDVTYGALPKWQRAARAGPSLAGPRGEDRHSAQSAWTAVAI